MRKRFIIAMISTTLLLLTYFWSVAAGSLIWSRYSKAAGLSLFSSGTSIIAKLAAISFFVAAAIIGVVAALTPANRWRKLILVLPAYLLGFLLTGVLLYLLQIGGHGTFTSNWLYIGALTSAIAAIIVAVRIPFSPQILKPAMQALSIANVLGLLMWLGMVGITIIVMTNQPTPAAAGAAEVNVTPLLVSVGLITVFAIIGLVSVVQGRRATSGAASSTPPMATQPNYRAQAGPIVFSCIAISTVSLAFAQFVPVERPKPSTNGVSLKWNSEETKLMAQRACFDCHSNQVNWPWYSYVAPSSWLVIDHVRGGLNEINFEAVNEMPARRAANTFKHFEEQMKPKLMPPPDYMIMHPDARLTEEEYERLFKGLQETTLLTLPNQNK